MSIFDTKLDIYDTVFMFLHGDRTAILRGPAESPGGLAVCRPEAVPSFLIFYYPNRSP